MAGEWQTLPLEDCMAAIIDYRGKTPEKTNFGVPLVTAKVIKGGRIERPDEFIAEADFDSWMRRGMPERGDIVMTTEAPLGEVAQLDGTKVALAQRVITLRGKPDLLDNTFLKFLLQSCEVQEELRSRGTGTTVVGIRQSELRKVSLTLPPLAEQKAIAAVLGALDDKIELNRRMNATLEAMARALFQSWFVDFDPVRAKLDGRQPPNLDPATAALFPDSFQDSELGEIPKGWRTGTLGELVELRTGRVDATPAKDHLRYVALEDMPAKSIDLSGFQLGSAVNSSIIAFRKGDVLFGSMRPYFHKVGLAFFDGITRSTTFVLRPRKDCYQHFALLHFFSDDVVAHSTTASVGTTIPYVKWDSLESYCIPVPPDSLLEAFENTVGPLVQRIAAQGEESRTLATLRDTLLPKLLRGELSVAKTAV
jgi:type I restriction enzyme S subunit